MPLLHKNYNNIPPRYMKYTTENDELGIWGYIIDIYVAEFSHPGWKRRNKKN